MDEKSKPELEELLELWKQGIETQMHFAELSIKMCQLGLTLAGATLALTVVVYRSNAEFSIEIPFTCLAMPIATLLCLSAAIILFAAKTLDAGMYHTMLRGAVKFNDLLEVKMDEHYGWSAGLTETISAYSRFKKPELTKFRSGTNSVWSGKKIRLAGARIETFYWICIGSLVLAAIGFLFATNVGQIQ